MNNIDSIILRRKLALVLPAALESSDLSVLSGGIVGALASNVMRLGFVLNPDALRSLASMDKEVLRDYHSWLVRELRELVGVRNYVPMYPNFPQQVMDIDEEQLLFNAFMHYFGDAVGLRILPDYEKEKRLKLEQNLSDLKTLRLISSEEKDRLLTEILMQKTSPSETDKADILVLYKEQEFYGLDIPNKEMLAYFLSLVKEDKERFKKYRSLVKTSTDVLRIAVALSGGDLSLAEDSKFINFRRSDRRFLLYLLNRIRPEQAAEDMLRFEQKWKRLGERLHPGEYCQMFVQAYAAFDKIRNGKVRSYYSKVEESLSVHDLGQSLTLLTSRPGEFARILGRLLRICAKEQTADDLPLVLEQFASVASNVSTNVLWTLFAYFRGYHHLLGKDRTFFPKGNVTKPIIGKNYLTPLGQDLQQQVCRSVLEVIKLKYSQLPPLGAMYIDPLCKGLVVPTGTRSTSKQLRTVGRGSRIALDKDTQIVRFFMWWKDIGHNRVDLDLSAVIFDQNWNMLGRVNWTQLRSGDILSSETRQMYEGLHSGDITSAPKGACEFIDINLGALRKGAAYVAMAVFSYTGQMFDTLTDSFAGFMSRKEIGKVGEIYEAPTVSTKFDLTSKATSVCPLILDIKELQVIWTDLALKKSARCSYVEDSWSNIALAGQSIADYHLTRPSLYDVFLAHRLCRGQKSDKEQADFDISEDGHISPYDVSKFMSEFL